MDYYYYFNILKNNITYHNVPVGAILINPMDPDNYIMDWNGHETMDHCELLVLKKGQIEGWDISQCIIIVSCEPCFMCFGALSFSRIKKIIFGCYNDKFGFFSGGYNLLNNGLYTPEFLGGFQEDFWASVLKNFFKSLR